MPRRHPARHRDGSNTKVNKANGRKDEDGEDFEKLLNDLTEVTKEIGNEQRKKNGVGERASRRSPTAEADKAVTSVNGVASKTVSHGKKGALETRTHPDQSLLEAKLNHQLDMMIYRKFLENSQQMMQGSFLNKPNINFCGHTVTDNPRFTVAVGEMQGWRANMEDEHMIDVAFSSDDARESEEAVFGVFDGHSGKGCATACSKTFSAILRQYATMDGHSYQTIDFTAAFLDLDKRIERTLKDGSGCTAVVVHVTPQRVCCASVGDSRAVLCRNGTSFDLSVDHKPDQEVEKERIVAAGGFVKDNRVNGCLAMSRAMGDYEYKSQKQLSQTEQLVTPQPRVIEVERGADDTFVVLACDGIFDVLSNEEVVAMVQRHKDNGVANEQICEAICKYCLEPTIEDNLDAPPKMHSMDNMTIMIVDLN